MYDSLNLNSQVRSIFYKKKFINLFSKLLNTNVNNIYISNFQFRLDPPRDKRNALDWHQDSSYFHINYPKFNAGVCWISITNNTKKNGTLIYIPKTHTNNLSKYKSVRKSIIGADQRKIKISPTEKKQIVNMNSNFGDVSCFHINIKHRSGFNKSKKIRMSVGCRFYDMNTSFNMGKERYIFNKTIT